MAWSVRKASSGKSGDVGFANDKSLPEGLAQALSLLDCESMVLAAGEAPLFMSESLLSNGLIRDGRIQSEDLLALIRVVRRTSEIHEKFIEIARSPIGTSKRELKVKVAPLDDGGTVLVLITDESEFARVDAIRRDFVTNISHELKTPISAIGLLSDSILEAKNDPILVERWAKRMQSEAQRLNNLVQEIINLSRIQDSDPMQYGAEVKVRDAVNEAINECETTAAARHIAIETGESLDVSILGNREQLVMAIHNLIDNAINYSGEGTKVIVSVKVSNGIVEISVTDQGIGIPESEIDRIFERFYRVDPARSRATGGTGLGLSIVKHVVANHGGEVKVWSVQSVGSTFSLRLPLLNNEGNLSKE